MPFRLIFGKKTTVTFDGIRRRRGDDQCTVLQREVDPKDLDLELGQAYLDSDGDLTTYLIEAANLSSYSLEPISVQISEIELSITCK